jgi:hypothetical protein
VANEAETGEVAAVEDEPKAWQPSRVPEYRADQRSTPAGLIVERPEAGGLLGAIIRFLRRPFVKLVLGLGLFILGAIVYDAKINFGSWTERKERQRATAHKGVPQGPDDSP